MFNSKIYESELSHIRTKPRPNKFKYKVYHFFLDLDEIGNMKHINGLLGYEKFSLLSFFEKDHLKFAPNHANLPLKDRVKNYLSENKIEFVPEKIFLLTHLRVLHYVFNPVSLYYCYDSKNNLRLVLAEVNNTFLEQKGYIIDMQNSENKIQDKNFYVSPFIHHNCKFEFKITNPNENIFLNINSKNEKTNEIILTGILKGSRSEITTKNLIRLNFKYPLVTFKVIFLIHWQAFKLFLKKVTYFSKKETDSKILKSQEAQNAS